MGLGGNFYYKEKLINEDGTDYKPIYKNKRLQNTSVPDYTVEIHAASSNGALTTHYYAPDDSTSVVFIAPPEPQKNVLPVFKAKDFHYEIHGGKGTTIYKLGHQQATIHCGSGINIIEIPFNKETEQRTITLKDFRVDSCFLTLKGIRVDFDLFQHAKIGLESNSSLFLKFGSTKIDFGASHRKTLHLRTDDGFFEIDTQNYFLKNPSPGTEENFKDSISSSIISHTDRKDHDNLEKMLFLLKRTSTKKLSFLNTKKMGIILYLCGILKIIAHFLQMLNYPSPRAQVHQT